MSKDFEMRTSQEWYEDIPQEYGFVIIRPDGWDKRNYTFSFTEELITKEHFIMRVRYSICVTRTGFLLAESDWAKK